MAKFRAKIRLGKHLNGTKKATSDDREIFLYKYVQPVIVVGGFQDYFLEEIIYSK